MTVHHVALAEFKARMSYYLSKAERGQLINIISNGELIARVFPPAHVLEDRSKVQQKAGIVQKSGKKHSR